MEIVVCYPPQGFSIQHETPVKRVLIGSTLNSRFRIEQFQGNDSGTIKTDFPRRVEWYYLEVSAISFDAFCMSSLVDSLC